MCGLSGNPPQGSRGRRFTGPARHGHPQRILMDNGPEFTSKALDRWAWEHRVHLAFIEPDKPVQNACVESFNGTCRDECLNEKWFLSLADARTIIEKWRI